MEYNIKFNNYLNITFNLYDSSYQSSQKPKSKPYFYHIHSDQTTSIANERPQ